MVNIFTPYSYQEQAQNLLTGTDKNILVIAPTGAGKTESGFTGLEVAGKGVLIEPTRALCYEKAGWLKERFPDARVKVGNKDYALSIGSFRDSHLRVLTPWKLGVILHNDPNFGQHCPMVVLDEVHNLDPESELIISKLRQLYPGVKIVGLSATIHEDDEPKLSSWLDAAVVKSDERPVPLVTRIVHFDFDLNNDDSEEITNSSVIENGNWVATEELDGFAGTEERVAEVVSYIRENGDNAPILVYTPYRERARNIALHLAEELGVCSEEAAAAAQALPSEAGDFTETLQSVLPAGIGIHHGGCTKQEQETVFELALAGKLQVIVCCETLAQGINLPARHVIVESIHQEPKGGSERQLMDVSRFWQLAGRAGRPQFDTIGYVWIVSTSEIEKAEIEEVLLKQKASKIKSRIYDEYFLTAHVAGLMQLGYNTPEKLVEFIRGTYFGSTLSDTQPLVEQFERIIRRLIVEDFAMTVRKMVVLTDRGQRLARLGLHPDEYAVIEQLINSENTDYETWVRQLSAVCADYALRGKVQADEEIFAEVAQYGMTAYAVKTSWAVRELVDYVGRLLELTVSLLRFNNVTEDYQRRFRQDVLERFNFGQVEIARRLARVLRPSEVKRLLRNLGPTLGAQDLGPDGDQPVFDDATLGSIAKVLWSQGGLPPNGQVGKVAGVLGTTEKRFRWLAKATLAGQKSEGEVDDNE